MFIHAFVAAVRARPEPSVFTILDGVNEVFTHFIGGGFGIAVLAKNHLSQFLCGSSNQRTTSSSK